MVDYVLIENQVRRMYPGASEKWIQEKIKIVEQMEETIVKDLLEILSSHEQTSTKN